uniref:Copia protein n=1 Tax=Tanacetum cinerariifolium TaxID=118510 RepID=A0A6L2L677_TANCI|nr:copia protein [Tanacetum cinerariifolium]
MFRINPFKTSREDTFMPINKVRARVRTNLTIVSQPHVFTKGVNSNLNGLSSTGVENTVKTRRPQSRSNTKNDMVPCESKNSCIKNKEVEVEEHPRNLLLYKNKKHMSSEFNNVKLAIRNDKSKVLCAMCKQCLIISNHDVCVLNYVNDMNSRDKKQNAMVSKTANQKKHKPHVKKQKKVGSKERFASPKPSKPRNCLRWSPTGRIFDLCGKIIESSNYKCKSDTSVCDAENASNPQEPAIKRFLNSTFFLGRLSKFVNGASTQFRGRLQKKYMFFRNLEGIVLLKGNHTINLYTSNLYEMASASPICLMARATSTKSWLWHQRLSHLNFDTIIDLAKNDLLTGLPKFKYHKEHLCASYEQGKSKKAYHPPKPVPNSKQRLYLLHMNLCGPIRIASINGKRTPQQNEVVERRNQTLVEATKTMLIFFYVPLFLWAKAIATACYTQNCSIIHRTIDPMLFIRRFNNNILVVQAYVDDIIFGSTNPRYTQLCFDLMKNRFEMSIMGEMTIFLGLQDNQSPRGIFINQSNYVLEILKKYGMETCDSVGTPMEINDKLDLDQNGTLKCRFARWKGVVVVYEGSATRWSQRDDLEALELKGSDGGAYEVLGWLLGSVMEVLGW